MNTLAIDPSLEEKISQMISEQLKEVLPAQIEAYFQKHQLQMDGQKPSLSIIASKGNLDMAYPPFILASTAKAMDWDVQIFFTFYGIHLLKKDLKDISLSALGNPAMPMKMPFGPQWFQDVEWQIPNLVQSNVPGFESFVSLMMKKTAEKKGVATIDELREECMLSGVRLVACQMALDLFGFPKEDLIESIEFAGAASFLSRAQKSSICLFV